MEGVRIDAFKEGRLQELLKRVGVKYDESAKGDPYDFLPTWLHPR